MLHSSLHRTLNVPFTVQIVDLEDENPTTDDEKTMLETKDMAASLPCSQAASLPCLQAASSPCLHSADGPCRRCNGVDAYCCFGQILQKWMKPDSGRMSTKTATSRGGDYLGHLRQEVKALRKPLFGFRKLFLRFICWLLPDPLDLLLNHTCLHN